MHFSINVYIVSTAFWAISEHSKCNTNTMELDQILLTVKIFSHDLHTFWHLVMYALLDVSAWGETWGESSEDWCEDQWTGPVSNLAICTTVCTW